MNEWTAIKTQADIDTLMTACNGFHDSCLVRLYYQTGDSVNPAGAMTFGGAEHKELHMIFHSQWKKEPLELCFTGVRAFHIGGYQERYNNDLFDCYLKLHDDLLLPRQRTPLIVWADWAGFSIYHLQRDVLREPQTSYVIASELTWKFLHD